MIARRGGPRRGRLFTLTAVYEGEIELEGRFASIRGRRVCPYGTGEPVDRTIPAARVIRVDWWPPEEDR